MCTWRYVAAKYLEELCEPKHASQQLIISQRALKIKLWTCISIFCTMYFINLPLKWISWIITQNSRVISQSNCRFGSTKSVTYSCVDVQCLKDAFVTLYHFAFLSTSHISLLLSVWAHLSFAAHHWYAQGQRGCCWCRHDDAQFGILKILFLIQPSISVFILWLIDERWIYTVKPLYIKSHTQPISSFSFAFLSRQQDNLSTCHNYKLHWTPVTEGLDSQILFSVFNLIFLSLAD